MEAPSPALMTSPLFEHEGLVTILEVLKQRREQLTLQSFEEVFLDQTRERKI